MIRIRACAVPEKYSSWWEKSMCERRDHSESHRRSLFRCLAKSIRMNAPVHLECDVRCISKASSSADSVHLRNRQSVSYQTSLCYLARTVVESPTSSTQSVWQLYR